MESMRQTSQDLKVYLTQDIQTQIISCYCGVCHVLLYGYEAGTITPRLSKDLDGCYTRLLRTAFNVHWKQHMTNQQLYGDLPKITDKIRERRLRFAGHCCRSSDETVSRLSLWNPKHGKRTPGRPSLTYIDQLRLNTGLEASDMRTAMLDRSV